MKGLIFKSYTGGWAAKYLHYAEDISSNKSVVAPASFWLELPLHPDNVVGNNNSSLYWEGKEVSFSIVGLDYDEVADKWYNMVAMIHPDQPSKSAIEMLSDEVIDELYSQYESEHSFATALSIHPMFYNGTLIADNSITPENPGELLTKDAFVDGMEKGTLWKWSKAYEVLFIYISKQKLNGTT